jgi:hypothetical protein
MLIFGGENPFNILEGPYSEFSSGWYEKVGALIVAVMILEIPIIHLFPINETIFFGCLKWHDRQWYWSDNKKSRKAIQAEYENINTGSVFDLDYRLAQIAVVVMHTFMFSVGLPILFLLAAMNFTMMYWMDKYLILRIYKTPVQYDHKPINFTLKLMRWSFLFHFFIGFYMITCDGILSSNN